MTSAPVLEVSGLSIAFAEAPVVRDVSFAVGEGEVVALVGESGSGKTLTSLAALGLLPVGGRVTSGAIRVDGAEITGASPRQLRALRGGRIGIVFQEPMSSLNPVLTVGAQIAEALRIHAPAPRRAIAARVEALLAQVGIEGPAEVARKYPHQLSGGMRQRVMIAIAISANPRLLIADEPTTALDATVQAQVLELMLRITRDVGASMLIVTHDLGVVAQIADRVVVMEQGEIREQGPVAEIFARPVHPYTRRLLAAVPRIDPAVAVPRGPEGPALLRVEGLSKTYRAERRLFDRGSRTEALKSVSLTLRAGETLGVVGESGSGKSTLGHVLARLVAPDAGQVIFDGRDIGAARGADLRALRRDIQMIFQDPFSSLDPRMRIDEIITEPLQGLGARDRRARAAALLDDVGLPAAFVDRFPHELSGGQRQRVSIARAISTRPRLVICDEPVSALDVSVQAQIIALLRRLQNDYGLAYIYIAHGLESVHAMSTDVAVMRRGEIVEYGPRDRIFAAPAHPYTRNLLAAMMVPDPARRVARSAK